ncbi:MAG: glycosyltransferase family 39 protein [Myxococcales bacterium]|nr:glycosyltransferase family 39 protein [Myxococcales bacterium]
MQLTRRREALAVAGCVALFLFLASVRARDRVWPYFDDVAFLDAANQVRDAGGPVRLLEDLWAGRWTEDNRHPLYVATLSLVAGREPGFHQRSIILTIFIGALALVACWWTARKRAGAGGALVLALFLATSETLIDYSARASAEPMLLLFWALALGAILDGERRWPLAGVFIGLAYLTKAPGIFLLFCFAGAMLLRRGFKKPYAWALAGGFAVTALPLLVRNVRVYGSPFHSWNDRLLYIDRLYDFSELYAPHAWDRLPHSFAEWARQATLTEIFVRRGAMGLGETCIHLGDAMSFFAPGPFAPLHVAGVILGLTLFVVAVRIVIRQPSSLERTLLLVMALFFFCFFWFFSAASGSSRYLFEMSVWFYAVLAAALWSHPIWLKRWGVAAALFVAGALVFDPSTRRIPAGYAEAADRLAQTLKPGDAYVVDSRSHFQPKWRLPASNRMETASSTWQGRPVPAGEMVDDFRRKEVRFVVLDETSRQGSAPRYFFFDQPQPPPALHQIWATGAIRILELAPSPAGAPAAVRAR